jgi:hypothetical protein
MRTARRFPGRSRPAAPRAATTRPKPSHSPPAPCRPPRATSRAFARREADRPSSGCPPATSSRPCAPFGSSGRSGRSLGETLTSCATSSRHPSSTVKAPVEHARAHLAEQWFSAPLDPGHRPRALPESQDDRVAPRQRLPQARHPFPTRPAVRTRRLPSDWLNPSPETRNSTTTRTAELSGGVLGVGRGSGRIVLSCGHFEANTDRHLYGITTRQGSADGTVLDDAAHG